MGDELQGLPDDREGFSFVLGWAVGRLKRYGWTEEEVIRLVRGAWRISGDPVCQDMIRDVALKSLHRFRTMGE